MNTTTTLIAKFITMCYFGPGSAAAGPEPRPPAHRNFQKVYLSVTVEIAVVQPVGTSSSESRELNSG